MKIDVALKKGIKKVTKIGRAVNKNIEETKNRKTYKILLLTNRDSDNVGDQVIETCDIALISTIMKNLNIESDAYKINSRAASMISQKYLSTKSPNLLKSARKLVKESDVIIFGGAPVFNYQYQSFYERTAVTLELAEEFHKPVIFSAIGIEGYDEDNAKCQRLKKTLNFDCVKQITTRDDFASLQKYIENDKIVIDKVSDPAVFSSKVFENYISKPKAGISKKIGIFILRANGFVDNKINFSKSASASFWKKLAGELKNNGYEYELLTSGHFGDEAFLDYLIRNCGIDEKNCVFNMNSPERLIQKISSYDAVVTCRLHPSIISFSLDVPSLGIVWNTKVRGFYDSIGYEDRVIETEGIDPKDVVEKIKKAMGQGVQKSEEYLASVYTSLFRVMKSLICPDSSAMPYSYAELMEHIPPYCGTSEEEYEEKLKRKFRRTYKTYNDRFEKNQEYQKTVNQLKAEIKRLKDESK